LVNDSRYFSHVIEYTDIIAPFQQNLLWEGKLMAKRLFRVSSIIIAFLIVTSLIGMTPEVNGMPMGVTVTPDILTDDYTENGNCSLREALATVVNNEPVDGCEVSGSFGYDTVQLSSGVYVLSLPGGEDLNVSGDLDIYNIAPGAPIHASLSPEADLYNLTIRGGENGSTIDANDIDRVLDIHNGSVLIDRVMITDGYSRSSYNGGGINIDAAVSVRMIYSAVYGNSAYRAGNGGGIMNAGSLILENVVIQNNTTEDFTTPLDDGDGGGIYNSGALTTTDVLIQGNQTGSNTGAGEGGHGAGVFNSGSATLTRVTIAENTCGFSQTSYGARGGGIYNTNTGVLHIYTSTISGNAAGDGGTGGGNHDGGFGGGIYDSYSTGISVEDSTIVDNHAGQPSGSGFAWGGGITIYSTALMKNTIIANNTASESPDCFGSVNSQGYNLIEVVTSGCSITGEADTITGQDPLLAPLADLGVEGWIHALQPGSPVIDAGPVSCYAAQDQRHMPRPVDYDRDGTITCDIGAYEAQLLGFLPLMIRP
jgi:hypothetical protein